MSIRRFDPALFFSVGVTAALRAMQGRYAVAHFKCGRSPNTQVGKREHFSVAEGKRRARKARNVRRHRMAMKRRGRA